jgi:hypothetical protein
LADPRLENVISSEAKSTPRREWGICLRRRHFGTKKGIGDVLRQTG